ncbi:MAG: NAD(P)H-hydrate dehydratase [Rhodanobacteraceae bacterium]
MIPDANARALYTAGQARLIDRQATDRCGIGGFTLMQRAAEAAFASLRRRWPNARHLCVTAGPGNNGGDAFLLASFALRAGFAVDLFALSDKADGDAALAREAFRAAGGTIMPLTVESSPEKADVHVDGLFGTGLRRGVEGAASVLIERLNSSKRPILALDVPSGLDADAGASLGPVVRASATVSFIAWKRGLFTGAAVDCCGELELAPLDVPTVAFEGIEADAHLIDSTISGLLPPRLKDSNKGRFGHVLVVGGDAGMGGAVRLTGEAALRAGAGLVSIATRASHVTALNAARPELMAHGCDDPQTLAPRMDRANVVALGPGLGTGAWGHALWETVLGREETSRDRAFVLDADALNLLARQPRTLPANAVLTPHPGEAARLLGCDVAEIQRDRFAAVRALAKNHAAVVVLKGAGSLIADPSGRVALCRWGNPGMASAGMGDVLTGVIAALLAQGLSSWEAASLGVAMHARAGDLAAGFTPRGLVASDLFASLRRLANGFPEDDCGSV